MLDRSKGIYLFLFLGILIPMSLDGVISYPVSSYDIRLNYFFTAALIGFYLYERGIFTFLTVLKEDLGRRYLIGVALISVVGLLGAYTSVNQKRALFFLIWSVGTMIAVPWVATIANLKLGKWFRFSVLIYAAFMASVAIWDFLASHYISLKWTIGRVFPANFYRPHAWYQEPNYLASFLMLTLLWSVIFLKSRDERESRSILVSKILLAAGILATTSKLGWMGLALFVSVLILMKAFSNVGILQRSLALIFITTLSITALFSVERITESTSFQERLLAAEAGIEVFTMRPFFGAGPGASGALFVDQVKDSSYRDWLLQLGVDLGAVRNDPLTKDLFTELLGDWGFFGFIVFLFLFFELGLKDFERRKQILIVVVFGCVYAVSQTFARYDIWMSLSIVSTFRKSFRQSV